MHRPFLPDSFEAWYLLGQSLKDCGRLSRAVEVMRRAVLLAPASEKQTALNFLEQNKSPGDNVGDVPAEDEKDIGEDARNYRDLAWIFSSIGDLQAAGRLLNEAVEIYPDQADPYIWLASLVRTTGNLSQAKDLAERACALSDSDRTHAEFLRVIEGDLKVFKDNLLPSVQKAEGYMPSDKKVLYALEMSLPHRQSGYTFRSHYVLKNLKVLGIEPAVSTRPGFPRDQGLNRYSPVDLLEGVPYQRLEVEGEADYNKHPLDLYLKNYAQCLYELALKEKPGLIHAVSNFKNGIAGRCVASALGLPFVYELRGLWEDSLVAKGVIGTDSEQYSNFRDVETACLNRADSVVTISEALKDEIVSRGVAADSIFVVPNAVDVDSFPPVEKDEKLASELILDKGPVLGYVGSLNAYEGIEVLVHAFAELLKHEENARLLLVGDGDEKMNLKILSTQLGVQDRVVVTGSVEHSQITNYYSLIDIFVLPRLPQRVCEIVTPLKPFEAMSTGRALLVSDLKALREMVIEGETGLLFKAGDAEHLASVCLELCRQPQRIRQLGDAAASWVRKNRTWEKVVPEYLKAYDHARQKGS